MMRQYETLELSFKGPVPVSNEAQANLSVVFSHEEEQKTVKGFYAGDGEYKVRFLPCKSGEYHYRAEGVINAAGTLEILPADKDHHGLVKAEGTHLCFEDGTLFRPFGTTIYAMMHQSDELIEETLHTLKEAPFNKVRLCVFPKDYEYNHNDPKYYPFEKDEEGKWNVRKPCYAFWDAFEANLKRLFELGYQVDLILFHPYDRWGFSTMSLQEDLVYLDYCLRRFAAYPMIWWSMANEYDILGSRSLEDWYAIEQFISDHDPYHHMLGNHQCIVPWDHSRPAVTHASMQTSQLTRVSEWMNKYHKPVLIDECCYEGDLKESWGSLSGFEMTSRFWKVFVQGGYCTHGETFKDPENEVVFWAKGGKLRGTSIPRIAFLKKIAEELPGPLEPLEVGLSKFKGLTEEKYAALKASGFLDGRGMQVFADRILALEPSERERFLDTQFIYAGHYKDQVYLMYLDRQTSCEGQLDLPEDGEYRIEVIDTWQMTRTVVMENARGTVLVSLPGKEGMAILAVKK